MPGYLVSCAAYSFSALGIAGIVLEVLADTFINFAWFFLSYTSQVLYLFDGLFDLCSWGDLPRTTS